MTVEEGCLAGGFGSAILEWSSLQNLEPGPKVLNMGIPDNFQEHATRAELLAGLSLDAAGITRRVNEWMEGLGWARNKAQSAS